jgi:hypothetical protein
VSPANDPWTVTAADDGSISSSWYVDPDSSAGDSLELQASDPTTSDHAVADFTDAIGSISPPSGPEGQGFTITVNRSGGANYTASTRIVFGGTTLTTTFVNASQVTGIVPASLMNVEEGTTKAVTTTSPAGGPINFAITEGDNFTVNVSALTATTNTALSNVTVATVSDTYDNPATNTFAATINWGDGSTSAGTITKTGVGAYSIAGSHTYTGQYWSTSVKSATTFPASTIPVANNGTTNFASAGSITVFTGSGYQTLTYTGKTGGTSASFTGVTGWTGNGTLPGAASITQAFAGVTVTMSENSPGTATTTATGSLTVTDGIGYSPTAGPFSTTEGQVYTGSSPFLPGSIGTSVFPSIGNYMLLASNNHTSAWYTLFTSGPNNYMYPNSTTGSLIYGDEGADTITETLYRSNGTIACTASGAVTVNDAGLSYFSATTNFTTTEGNGAGSIQVGKFLDSYIGDGDHSADFTVTIHWGDGNSDVVPALYAGAGTNAYTVNGSHTYTEESATPYQVTYDVVDDGGSKLMGTHTANVTVNDAPLTRGSSFSLTTPVFSSVSLASATFTDGKPGSHLEDFPSANVTINWGDTYTSQGTVSYSNGVYTVDGSHAYQNASTTAYNVSITVQDVGGSHTTLSGTILVNAISAGITVTPYSVQYDTSPHTATVTAIADTSLVVDLSNTTHTNAGDYPNDSWSFAGTNNYLPASGTVHDSIIQAPVTLTAVNQTVTYGNAPATTAPDAGSVSGIISPDAVPPLVISISGPLSGSGNYTFGSHTITPSAPGLSSNYKVTTVTPGVLTVNQKVLPVTVVGADKIYDGTTADPGATFTVSPISTITGTDQVTASGTGTFVTSHAGTGIQVNGSNLSLSGADSGNYSVGAMIPGSANITAAQTSTAVVGVPNPSILGQSVTFTVTVTNTDTGIAPAAGSVTFTDNGNPMGSGLLGTSTGNATTWTISTSSLTAGSHNNVATYNPTTDFVGSNGSTTQAVNYNWSGFQTPVSLNRAFKQGSTIPLKWQLTDVNGNVITSLSAINTITVSGPSGTYTLYANGHSYYTPGNSALNNDGSAYNLNWQTKNPFVNGTWIISLAVGDGTQVFTKQINMSSTGGNSAIVIDGTTGTASAGALLAGDLNVYVDNSSGGFTADEMARIQDTIANVNALVNPYGTVLITVSSPSDANVIIDIGNSTGVGGYADGVLGATTQAGEVTIVQGWNWYAGTDTASIGNTQYDFATVMTHEMGHAIGLGHSTDASSVMYASLVAGTAKRSMAMADLNIADTDGVTDGLRAQVVRPVITTSIASTAAPQNTGLMALDLVLSDQSWMNTKPLRKR